MIITDPTPVQCAARYCTKLALLVCESCHAAACGDHADRVVRGDKSVSYECAECRTERVYKRGMQA